MDSGIVLAPLWNPSLCDCFLTSKHHPQHLVRFLTYIFGVAMASTSDCTCTGFADAASDGSDFDVEEISDFDDFSVTNDDLRIIDYIDRELLMQDLAPVMNRVDDALPQGAPNPVDQPLDLGLNVEPQWTRENFIPRQVPQYRRLLLGTGIMKMPCLSNYWRQKKRLFKTEFGAIMTRDRFLMIWRFLHVANNSNADPTTPDRLAKLRPMLTYLNEKFRTVYIPYGHVSTDESMVKFKGRLGFRQYMPAKPIKWGIKVWCLAESSTGYMNSFQIYSGKEAGQEQGLAHHVVKDLLVPYHHSNIRVAMDNFYTSVPLLCDLHHSGICAAGTVRSNRKFLPKDLLPKTVRLEKHQFHVAQAEQLMYTIWMDTKAVCVLSNYHCPTQTGTVNRRAGRQVQQQVNVPAALADYQVNMKGIDLCDQMLGYYMPSHRSRKWWRRVFSYLLMASAHNAYVVAKDSNAEFAAKHWPGFQDFLEDLAEDLVANLTTTRAPPILHVARPCHYLHTLRCRPDGLYKVCVECKLKGLKGRTSKMMCKICNVPVHQRCLQEHQARMLGQ
ncbi:PiggyBac transposable element-derived protein 4-like [Plakobranchus ocellatus]|uniref:PiggyBac transposable element-derived protein 4-like n=1 Tax=Plakobranchus ocellatus TaxID=259542 RepID=A0AAV4D3N8_9GAST|nr:PiggyBac transposable element-derived protein 4-like [Plakobranchus ocellatus]